MRRREFIALLGGAAAVPSMLWPFAARAQQGKVWRIGVLRASPPPRRELEAFRRGLAEHGLVESRDYILIHHGTEEPPERLPALASALVNGGVDVILADGSIPARTARAATSTIPIVMVRTADPAAAGVHSLSRPGGNVTGLSSQAVDITGKLFELLSEIVSGLDSLASLAPRPTRALFKAVEDDAARALGLTLHTFDLVNAEAVEDALRQAVSAGAQAAVLRGTPFFSTAQRRHIVELAAEHRLPVMYEAREFVELGGLAAYATDHIEVSRRAAGYVAKIIQGANPGDLPIEQPTRFEFVLNLKTAKTLGLDIRPTLIARADEVIE
jgi:putative ABC transport system substrate-binding protein